MKNIAIYGVGGFGREVLTLIQHINEKKPQYNIIGFFDDGHPKNEVVNGFLSLGNMLDVNSWDTPLDIVVAVGNPTTKANIVSHIVNPLVEFPTLIHPTVIIGSKEYVTIGKGCVICANNILTTNIKVGDFVILNLDCTVGHDTTIGDYASFMPAVNISGEVTIGRNVYVGTGAKIINQLEIGEGTIVGAGAVVSKSLPSNCTAVGVPAKPIKFRE